MTEDSIPQPEIERAVLAATIEQALEAIAITDATGQIRHVNSAFSRLTGYSREEVVGRNPRMLKSGKQPAAFYKDMLAAILAGQVWHGELINRGKDGTSYREEMTITPVRDSSGATVNHVAIKQDLAARRGAEEAQSFLASIVESTEDAIVGHNPDGMIMSWNRGAEVLYGYPAEEILGKHGSLLVWPDNLEMLREVSERLQRGAQDGVFR